MPQKIVKDNMINHYPPNFETACVLSDFDLKLRNISKYLQIQYHPELLQLNLLESYFTQTPGKYTQSTALTHKPKKFVHRSTTSTCISSHTLAYAIQV